MKIDRALLQKLAHLARIEISPDMEAGLRQDLNQILGWVEKLDELDTTDVLPLTHLSMEKNAMREDKVLADIDPEQALKNAPAKHGQYFSVPKVLNKNND